MSMRADRYGMMPMPSAVPQSGQDDPRANLAHEQRRDSQAGFSPDRRNPKTALLSDRWRFV
jgi:hypothetical protein